MELVEGLFLNKDSFVIYGAQVVAYGAYRAILRLCNRRPDCFVVSSPDNNPSEIDGIPVRTPEAVSKDSLIILGVTELLQAEIMDGLKEKGFTNVFVLTQHEEYKLMSKYFESIGRFPAVKTAVEECVPPTSFVMYEVKNHRDKPLNHPPKLQPFETAIQAGAALTKERIASFADNTRENISEKNRQYCEMSAVYWVWKNTNHEWTGIEHYRRHLLVKPNMLNSRVDVILPLPYICYPHTMAQFRRFVSEDILQALLQALKVLHPKEYGRYHEILYGSYQYTYNLICARQEVFHDYCRWFFRITEFLESRSDEVSEIKSTRALSYVAEVLTNLYFMYNSDRWNILHVEKEIYV